MRRIALIALIMLPVLGTAPKEPRPVPFDLSRSKMTVYVYKQGLFSFAADNHEVNVPLSAGSFNPAMQQVQLRIDTKTMQVLDPPSRRDKVQANMDGPQVLDVDRYPTITFQSTKIDVSDPGHWIVTGDLTLHGQTHPIDVSVTTNDSTHFHGSATITQTTFGITPIQIAGGMVGVKDDVRVDFDIFLK
jgi:hypothetical protein